MAAIVAAAAVLVFAIVWLFDIGGNGSDEIEVSTPILDDRQSSATMSSTPTTAALAESTTESGAEATTTESGAEATTTTSDAHHGHTHDETSIADDDDGSEATATISEEGTARTSTTTHDEAEPTKPTPEATTTLPDVHEIPETIVVEIAARDATTTATTPVIDEPEIVLPIICGEGMVKLDEFVTETDNGCRPAECFYGRRSTGECRWYSEWATELVRECPTVDLSDGLGAMDINVSDNSAPAAAFPQLEAGTSWTAEISLVDNRHFLDGIEPEDSTFTVSLATPSEDGSSYVPTVPGGPSGSQLLSVTATDGRWSVPFSIHENTPLDNPFELGVGAKGAGCWAVRFNPS